jgi:hypothetical protein
MDAAPYPTHDPVLMSILLIVGLIVLAVWLVESIVFLASYKYSRTS